MIKRLVILLLIIFIVLFSYPIIHTVMYSLMDVGQANSETLTLIPNYLNVKQYFNLSLFKSEYFYYYLTSVKITFTIIVGQILFSLISAYIFAMYDFRFKKVLLFTYILLILLPFQVTLVPNIMLFNMLNKYLGIQLFDSHLALILPGTFNTLGFFLLYQMIKSIPNSIFEAAEIDGTSDFYLITHIVFPLVKNGIYVLTVLTFIDNWNVIEEAVVFLDTMSKYPLSLHLKYIFTYDSDVFYAAAVLYMLPAILVIHEGYRYLEKTVELVGGYHEK